VVAARLPPVFFGVWEAARPEGLEVTPVGVCRSFDPRMPTARLSRYLSGERDAVWKELIALGDQLDDEAEAVVTEVVRRCRDNIVKIANVLTELGYHFARPNGPYEFRTEAGLARLEEAELAWGRFPRLVRRLYETFEFVDFSQHEDQDAGPLRGMGYYPQLLFLSLPECAELREEMKRNGLQHDEFMRSVMQERGEEYVPPVRGSFLALGPCASNNDMKGFELPCHSVDAVYFDDGAGPVYLYEDLRRTFEWGGFPQLAAYVQLPSICAAHGPDEPLRIRDRLKRDLEPL
jgi:hypothetical protein